LTSVYTTALSGPVYRDDSRNGGQDGTEPGYSGVTVQLLDASGNVVATTTTDALVGLSSPRVTGSEALSFVASGSSVCSVSASSPSLTTLTE